MESPPRWSAGVIITPQLMMRRDPHILSRLAIPLTKATTQGVSRESAQRQAGWQRLRGGLEHRHLVAEAVEHPAEPTDSCRRLGNNSSSTSAITASNLALLHQGPFRGFGESQLGCRHIQVTFAGDAGDAHHGIEEIVVLPCNASIRSKENW